MTPIFKEYIKFLRDSTKLPLEELKEGYFWFDKSIIKGFDKYGCEHKFFKVIINDSNETVDCCKLQRRYDDIKDIELASWYDLLRLWIGHLRGIEKDALYLIQNKIEEYKNYTPIIPVSTGKDSMVICYLVRSLYPDTKAIFNNTSLDCADTYRMIKRLPNCEIMNPKEGFYQYIKRTGMIPTQMTRFCCSIFKSGVMTSQLDHKHPYLLFMGMRNEESVKRREYKDEWVNTREWGNTNWKGILPIRTWNEFEVWLYIFWKGLEINPKYKKGYMRAGCTIACPFSGKSTWTLDKYWYPIMRERWENILRENFISDNKWIILNCTLNEYINKAWNGGVFRDEPTDEVIEEFAQYNMLDKTVASKYFNKNCDCCGTKIKDKNALSMNMKIHGRSIGKYYCKKCLMKEFRWFEDDWNQQIDKFKNQGCALF